MVYFMVLPGSACTPKPVGPALSQISLALSVSTEDPKVCYTAEVQPPGSSGSCASPLFVVPGVLSHNQAPQCASESSSMAGSSAVKTARHRKASASDLTRLHSRPEEKPRKHLWPPKEPGTDFGQET